MARRRRRSGPLALFVVTALANLAAYASRGDWHWITIAAVLTLVLLRKPIGVALRALIGVLAKLRGRRRGQALQQGGQGFYQSREWRRLSGQVKRENVRRFGVETCELCGSTTAETFHSHHLWPRSTHPELALVRSNIARWCDQCNLSASNDYVGRDQVPNPRKRAMA